MKTRHVSLPTFAVGGMLAFAGCAEDSNRPDTSAQSSASAPSLLPCGEIRGAEHRDKIMLVAKGVVHATYATSPLRMRYPNGADLGLKLLNFYMYHSPPCGKVFTLSNDEAHQVLAETQAGGKPIDLRLAIQAEQLSDGRWRKKSDGRSLSTIANGLPRGRHKIASSFLGHGSSYVTNLHGLDAHTLPGGVLFKDAEGWSYHARLRIEDWWDFDKKESGGRNPLAEAITRISAKAPGNPFLVTSPALCIMQRDNWTHLEPDSKCGP